VRERRGAWVWLKMGHISCWLDNYYRLNSSVLTKLLAW
jgi:hypothetical protein